MFAHARAHLSIVMEVKADRNAALMEELARRQLDFALTFAEQGAPGAGGSRPSLAPVRKLQDILVDTLREQL